MAAEVEAEQGLLVVQHLELRHLVRLAQDEVGRARGAGVLGPEHVEERALAAGAFLALAREVAADGLDRVHQVAAVLAGEVEAPGAHEAVEGAGVEVELAEAAHEVGEVLVRAVLLALGDDVAGGLFADALDGAEAEADGVVLDDGREVGVGLVHVGAEGLHAEGFDLRHEFGELVRVALFGREHRGHELDRIVGLQVGGAVREDGVGGGVRLVEAVLGELLQGGEDLLGLLLVDVVGGLGALDEDRALLLHLLADLLAHRAAEHVGAAEGVAGDDAGGFHHLFLVDQDAVGLLGDLLEERVRVFDEAGVVLALDVVRDELHRARTVERDERDDLVDLGDVELAAERLHAAGFELEHADGLRLIEEGEGLGVVEADFLDVEVGQLAVLADEILGVVDDRERLEAQEVHLQEAELLDGILGILGRQVAFLHRHRDDVGERAVGDDHAARVLAGVAHHALDDAAGLDDAGGLGVDADLFAELVGLLERVLERDVDVVGDELGEAVGLDERQVADAGEVADDHLGAERAEGDDVGDAVLAVFLAHVADDLVAAAHAEVDVEVGRGDALRVQEAFEEQAEADRIDVGDLEAVRHDRAGARASSRADGDILPT